MTTPEITDDRATIVVHVPLTFKRYGGRKLIVAPDGDAPWQPAPAKPDGALLKALARAHRWRGLIDDGTHATVQDLADAEKVNPSYVARVIRLTLLGPRIVDAILDGLQPPGLRLEVLFKPFSLDWREQYRAFRLVS